jgi:hypothetical protein
MRKSLLCSFVLLVTVLFAAAAVADTPRAAISKASPFEDPEPASQMAPPGPALAPGATGTTLNVPVPYATIQAAIDAAAPSGDVIVVATGTYAEAIVIDNKNVTIQGAGTGTCSITGSTGVTQYIVKITNGAVVDFSGFTVDGTGKDIQYGIWATASTDGDIHDNVVKNVSYPGAVGLAVRRQDSQIDITHNNVYGFGRIGIYTRDDVILNTDGGVIHGNTVTGLGGGDPARLSYGISVYSGNPTVDGNDISGCVSGSGVAAWASSAIDVWTGSTSALTNNYIHDSEYGIISNSASPAMSGNTFSAIAYDEVRLDYFVKGNPTPHWAEYYNTIQAAVDAIPSTTYPVIVWVAIYSGAGTYVEQVEVTKDCEIIGAGTATTIIQSPATLTKYFTTSVNNKPIVYIHDTANVVLWDLTVDGLGLGNANYRFIGVGFRNAGGAVYGCDVLNIEDTPFSGAQHGVAIYAWNDDAVSRNIAVDDCDILGFQKNGMALNASDTTPLVVSVTNNRVTGAGATGVTAQNGIQVSGLLATGTVADNTVSGIGYTGSGWVATSILTFYGDIDITGNTITGGHMGIYVNDGSGEISGNDLTIEKIGYYADGICATDPPRATPSPFTETGSGGPSGVAGIRMAPAAVLDLDVSGNSVVFSGADNTGTYGVEFYAGYSSNQLAVTSNNNTVTGFDYGFVFSQCTGDCDTGTFTSITATGNSIVGNASYGMYSDASALTVNAENNWWGDASGPYHETLNDDGLGNAVTDYIDFDPYMTDEYEISVAPAYGITNCSTPITYTYHITQAGVSGTPIRGYDVKFDVDNAVVTVAVPSTDVAQLPYLSSVGGTSFYVLDNTGGTYTVSCAILGTTVGRTGDGDLFTVKLTPVGAGTSAISMVSLKLRDVNNLPIDVAGVGGTVQIDCTAPTMEAIAEAEDQCYNVAPTFSNFGFDDDVNLDLADYQIDALGWNSIFSGVDAASWDSDGWELPGFTGLSEGSHTVYFRVKDDAGNWDGMSYSWSFVKDTVAPSAPTDFVALPGYNKVHLTWTNPTSDFVGVEIRRVAWGDYADYATSAPSYPADETEGTLVTQTGAAAYDDATMSTARDIYYYTVFTYDCAGNYSVASSTAQDRSTSYWLGDINPASVGNGIIDLVDLSVFAAVFGKVEGPTPAWNEEADFGPTDDWSRFGIPMPDNIVDFEDLMIFAMNYANVSPSGTSGALIALTGALPLGEQVSFRLVPVSREDGKTTYAVVMENGSEILKGFSLKVAYGVGNGLEGVTASREMTGKGSEHFFGVIERETGVVEICVAALGVNKPFEYTGEVARIVVREETEGSVALKTADLRDVNNGRDEVALPGGGGEVPYIPVTTALLQNHPNPFNPTTAIPYEVAVAGRVELAIYDVSGSLVRTLVNGEKGVGRYTATWDGRDGRGNQVHTGVYFYRMTAPGYTSQAKKMLLLK